MQYLVLYETPDSLVLTTIGRGSLTSFINLCKRIGWQILKIETVDPTGRVVRTAIYQNGRPVYTREVL